MTIAQPIEKIHRNSGFRITHHTKYQLARAASNYRLLIALARDVARIDGREEIELPQIEQPPRNRCPRLSRAKGNQFPIRIVTPAWRNAQERGIDA